MTFQVRERTCLASCSSCIVTSDWEITSITQNGYKGESVRTFMRSQGPNSYIAILPVVVKYDVDV